MYKTETFHIGDDDQVSAQREDDKLWITVLPADPPEGVRVQDGSWHRYDVGAALEIFVDPVHFAALRHAMDMIDARIAEEVLEPKLPGDI